ncbi:alpha/beta fold hydrolase [Alkalihalobacillus sp. CinArs1]|uniref:alpha/beta fold hydrolase n=1 Tax=Alkalihalobacillus sp. CinArs1 TaxID=2995314 RepID=UPI0022DE4D3B|nr:alpha/beta hydrolase [Alkalihalobacillus sp. CinArs1]
MHNGKLIPIRGKELYVEVHGSPDNPPLLYLHGGPGESCFNFSYHQSARLEKDFMVIAIDQRGVCRSEGVTENEDFKLQDLIEDCEALRDHFSVDKWSLIGHSFGGFLSVLYAATYPDSIDRVVLECPTFDFDLTSRSLMRKTASLLEKHGQSRAAIESLTIVTNNELKGRELAELYSDYSDLLGENRMEIYMHNHDHPTDYSYYSDEKWDELYDKSEVHYNLLRAEGRIFDSLLPLLNEIKSPTLLLTGKYDPVTSDLQVQAFRTDVELGETYHFEDSGHTPHDEEPEHFANVIKKFIS